MPNELHKCKLLLLLGNWSPHKLNLQHLITQYKTLYLVWEAAEYSSLAYIEYIRASLILHLFN